MGKLAGANGDSHPTKRLLFMQHRIWWTLCRETLRITRAAGAGDNSDADRWKDKALACREAS